MSKGMWDWKKLMFSLQGGLCFLCGAPMTLEKEHSRGSPHYATRDHLVPRSAQGSESWANTVLACRACNQNKAGRSPTEQERARQQKLFQIFRRQIAERGVQIEEHVQTTASTRPFAARALEEEMRASPAPVLVRDYHFKLPPELIAQEPPAERSGARMLVLERETGACEDRQFTDLSRLLRPGDLLVLNDSRVLPARLFARSASASPRPGHAPARIEVLLTEENTPGEWTALVRPGRKVRLGERLVFPPEGAALLEAEVIAHGEFGARTLRFAPAADFYAALDALGQMPLPPYIHREQSVSTAADRERYQTVYARERGSVAAPTAGLHFTPEVLEAIRARGVEIAYVTLHVGLGTFQPVRVERLSEIKLHRERYTLSAATAAAVNRALTENRRIVAAGTTTVRTLEHCARADGRLAAHSGSTDIFISPGYRFRVVGGLLTNFHLPQSTLLMLVCAFAGYDATLAAYRHAVAQSYRFFSYGDCMLVT